MSGGGPKAERASVAIKDAMEIFENENEVAVRPPGQAGHIRRVGVMGAGFPIPRPIYGVIAPVLKGLFEPRTALRPKRGRQGSVTAQIPDANHGVLGREIGKLRPEAVLSLAAVGLRRRHRKSQDRRVPRDNPPAPAPATRHEGGLREVGLDPGGAGLGDHLFTRSRSCRE